MIDPWNDLAYSGDPKDASLNELKAWLRSNTQESQTAVTPTSHALPLLRWALCCAISDIAENLDEQIGILVTEAEPLNIQVQFGEYFCSRVEDWDNVGFGAVDEMGAQEVLEFLGAAKREIAW